MHGGSAEHPFQYCNQKMTSDMMLALSDSLTLPEWANTLLVLKAEDVRGSSDALMGELEGRRRPSWIWMTNTGILADGAGDEGLYSLVLTVFYCQG